MIPLDTEHEKHLKFLVKQPLQVLQDFCKLSADFLHKGHNFKLYNTAAQKLEVEPDIIKQSIEGIIYLIIISAKNKLTPEGFQELVVSIGFTDGTDEVLCKLFAEKSAEIDELMKDTGLKLPRYHNMEWRFEVQVASRTMLSQLTPFVTMDLALNNVNNSSTPEHIILQADATNIVHLTEELEGALHEGRSQHLRRVKRTLK